MFTALEAHGVNWLRRVLAASSFAALPAETNMRAEPATLQAPCH